jgi:hypothetical protein
VQVGVIRSLQRTTLAELVEFQIRGIHAAAPTLPTPEPTPHG